MQLKYRSGKKPKDLSLYYHLEDDIKKYADAIIFLIYGGRFTGKTFSSLEYTIKNNMKFIFMKRTNEDVDQLVAESKHKEDADIDKEDVSLDPFVDLNECFQGINYKPFKIQSGLAAYYNCDAKNNPVGSIKGYIMSLNKVAKYKGMGALKTCDIIIFDEFVPTIYQIIRKGEGKALLDLYLTVTRDREMRGLPPIILVCLANADNVQSPTTEELNITDIIADMEKAGISIKYLEDRFILIHKLNDNKKQMQAQAKTKIYKTMQNTPWASMSLENKFAYNDFSDVQKKMKMKNFRAMASFSYKNEKYYIYIRDFDSFYYITSVKSDRPVDHYDLSREAVQNKFYYDFVIDIKNSWQSEYAVFSKYTLKDLFINYRKIYNIY